MRINASQATNCSDADFAQGARMQADASAKDRAAGPTAPAACPAEAQAPEQDTSAAQRQRDFNRTYAEWIAAQATLVDRIGVFGEELRPTRSDLSADCV